MAHGAITGWVGEQLTVALEGQPLTVYYDHGLMGTAEVGCVNAWFSESYSSETQLAQVDIAVVEKESQRVLLLVEIEESPIRPKGILGDALAILIGDHITFKRKPLLVDSATTLCIMVRAGKKPMPLKVDYLTTQLLHLKDHLTSANAAVGDIVIESWETKEAILARLLAILAPL